MRPGRVGPECVQSGKIVHASSVNLTLSMGLGLIGIVKCASAMYVCRMHDKYYKANSNTVLVQVLQFCRYFKLSI